MDAAPTTLLSALEGSSVGRGYEDPAVRSLSDRLQKWNGGIESEFSNPPSSAPPSETTNDDSLATLEAATKTLHQHLVLAVLSGPLVSSAIRILPPDRSETGIRSDDVVGDIEVLDDVEADAAASRAAAAVRDREEKSPPPSERNDNATLILTSDLLRACKNVSRWTNQRRAMVMRYRGQPSPEEADHLVAEDGTRRLRRPGTLKLYLALLECCSNHYQEGDTALTPLDSVAQTASLALFHATFGVGEPVADAARSALIGQSVGFVPSLARLIQLPHPLPLLISLLRHVHSLVGSDSTMAKAIDSAVSGISSSNDSDKESEDKNLASVLVDTLAWALRSDPPFPGADPGDRRSDLAVEVLRIMFVLQSRGSPPPKPSGDDDGKQDNDIMTQMGILIGDILQLPNADFRAYDTKMAAVNLLMDCPGEYGQYLLLNSGIPPLLAVLNIQLSSVVVERTGNGAADTAAIVPILVTLTRLSAANAEVRRLIKEGVFPPDAEIEFQVKAREEREKMGGGSTESVRAKNMSPLDAPRGTVRWKLVRLMTWTESNVKRCASELLWALCNEDATEFVLRTGFGNAIHMLGIKGLVTIPKESIIDI